MSALAALRELGAQPHLAADGRLVVGGLDRLPPGRAVRAVELARAHKAEVVSELKAQALFIPALPRDQCREALAWPIETQRLFAARLDALEAQGHPLPVAESLAFAQVRYKTNATGVVAGAKPEGANRG
jgi:hypothetical protein